MASKLCHRAVTDASRSFASDATKNQISSLLFSSQREQIIAKLAQQNPSLRPADGTFSAKHADPKFGVLVPLIMVNDKPSVLFTLRSRHLFKHRAEVSFPGGNVKEGESLLDSALREAYEEIGLEKKHVDIWGQLPASLTSRLDQSVTPFLGIIDPSLTPLDLIPDGNEVELVFTRTIQDLCQPANVGHTQFLVPERYKSKNMRSHAAYSLPVFLGGPHRIWGLSAVILHQVLLVLAPDHYKPTLKTVR